MKMKTLYSFSLFVIVFIFQIINGANTESCSCFDTELSSEDKELLLKSHNELRQKVANGSQANQPAASNMLEMVWNDELESLAMDWAEQCKGLTHNKPHSKQFEYVGQNLWISYNSIQGKKDFRKPVYRWFNEVVSPGFDAEQIEPYQFIKGTGHYTQLVWAESYALGCAFCYSKHEGETPFHQTLICNYGPGGNTETLSMYKKGDPCSACPKDSSCSKSFPGLCSRK